jgi:hypothetical protein
MCARFPVPSQQFRAMLNLPQRFGLLALIRKIMERRMTESGWVRRGIWRTLGITGMLVAPT